MFGAGMHGGGGGPSGKSLPVHNWRPPLVTSYDYLDDFYGFGDVSILNRVLPILPKNTTKSWIALNTGTAVLANGRLEARFPSINSSMWGLDYGTDGVAIRCEFELPASTSSMAVVARCLDSTNFWIAQVAVSGGTSRIIQVVNGTFTNRKTGTFNWLINTRYSIVFTVDGNNFSATYNQVVNGVDVPITPLTGVNPQTYDASSTGSDSGRTKHGFRAGNSIGGAAVRIYRYESSPTTESVDDTLTVTNTGGVVSRLVPAVSLVETTPLWNTAGWATAKPNINAAVGAIKIHQKDFGLLDPWASNSSGPTESAPSLWNDTTKSYLPRGLNKIREINAAVPIILTIYAATWWMKQTVFNDVIANLTSNDAYSDSGRVKYSQLPNFLILVDGAVRKAEAEGCLDFEVWNEVKGWYDVYPHVGQKWDATMNPGNTVDHPVMGFSYFYQQVANQIISTMTSLGHSYPGGFRIGGPYVTHTSQSTPGTNTISASDGLYQYGPIWGYTYKANVNFIKEFLDNVVAHSMPLDTFLIDVSTGATDNVYASSNPFDLTRKFGDIPAYWRGELAARGLDSDIAIDFSEIYPVPQPALRTADSEPLRAAMWADTLMHALMNRVRYPIMWGPTAPVDTKYSNLANIIKADGTMQMVGTVFQFFKDHFGPGTTVYAGTSANGKLAYAASSTHLAAWNRTATDVVATVDGDRLSFTHYETKLITR